MDSDLCLFVSRLSMDSNLCLFVSRLSVDSNLCLSVSCLSMESMLGLSVHLSGCMRLPIRYPSRHCLPVAFVFTCVLLIALHKYVGQVWQGKLHPFE